MIATAAAAVAVVAGISARWHWWRRRACGLPVLMYHKVGNPPPGSRLKPLWVRLEAFRRQMDYLNRRGYTSLLFSELQRIYENRLPLPSKPVLVTFDDGYANNAEAAFPVLQESGVKANIFLVYETIGRHNEWHDPATEPWLRMLTWGQVRALQESGLVEFGSHTMRHRHLPSLPLDEARWELFESKRRLEEALGRPVTAFAYPYGAGAYVPRLRAAAREAGYVFDFGIRQGFSPWPWTPVSGPLKRLYIRGDDYRLDFHLQITRGKSRF